MLLGIKRTRFFAWAIAAVVLFALIALPSTDASATITFELFGHQNSTGTIKKIDTSTGIPTTVGLTGIGGGASGMATSRAPTVTAIGTLAPGTHFGQIQPTKVVAVDTVTGAATLVVTTSRNISGRGIGFGSDGKTLFVIEGSAGGPLSTIDLITGTVTLVANTGSPAVSLEWDPASGKFLAISGTTLRGITETGVSTAIGPTGGGACTLTRDPGTGTWFTIIGSKLSTLNPLTGATAVVPGAPTGLGNICGTAFAPARPLTFAVDIDIKPNSDPSSYGCKSKGSIPVAVLGSSTFDATAIDADTVLFGATGTETGEVHSKKGSAKRHVEDYNGDGFLDMIFHFDFQSTGFGCDDIPPGEKSAELVGILTGELSDGTAIQGKDILRLTGK